jgi:hypothetical protein
LGAALDDDAGCLGAALRGRGVIKGSVGATAIEEAVVTVIAVDIKADDLAQIVDAGGKGAVGREGKIVDGCVATAAVEEAVRDVGAVEVIPDDPA